MLFKRHSMSRASAPCVLADEEESSHSSSAASHVVTKKASSNKSTTESSKPRGASKRPRSKTYQKSNSSLSLASGNTAATSLSSASSCCSKKTSKSTTSKTSKTDKKCVRFNEKKNQYHTDKKRKNLVKDCQKTWYSDEEYAVMRDNLRILVSKNKIRMIEDSKEDETSPLNFAKTLEGLLGKTNDVNYVLDDATRLPKLSIKKLGKLYMKKYGGGIEFIGLEHYLSSKVCLDSKDRRESIQELVADIQTEDKQGLWSDQDLLRLEYRDCCRQVTQAHCLMAQLLAMAQYGLTSN